MDQTERPDLDKEPPASEAKPAPPSPGGPGFVRRFLLMEDRIAAAEQQAHGGSRRRQEAFRRATAAQRAAEAVLANSRRESGEEDVASAVVLLKETLWWAIVAANYPVEPGMSAAEAWALVEAADPDRSDLARLSAQELTAVRQAIVDQPSIGIPERSRDDLRARLDALRQGIDAVLAVPYREARAVARLRMIRRLRWACVALIPVAIGASILTWRVIQFRRENVAFRKPVSASSREGSPPHADGVVDGKTIKIGFQTAREHRPWLRIDLLQVRPIHRITVYNADHCCFERAVPLVIEVSADGQGYHEVARRDRPFGVWSADLDSVEARFVKLYVDKTTIFHLSEVEIR